MSKWYTFFERIIPSKINTKELLPNAYKKDLQNNEVLNDIIAEYGSINYAGILGKKLIDVDIDDDKLYALSEKYLPKTLSTKNNNGINHYFYLNDIEFKNNVKLLGIEIRVSGHVTLPPSIVNDVPREWAYETAPISAKQCNILYAVKKVLFHYHFNANYPVEGNRNDVILQMSAWLCFAKFDYSDIVDILLSCGEDNNDISRESTIYQTITKYKNNDSIQYKQIKTYYSEEIYNIFSLIFKEDDNVTPLQWLNENYCYIERYNDIWDIEYSVIQRNLVNLNKFVLAKYNIIKDRKTINILDVWGRWEGKFKCRDVGFFPGKGKVVEGKLNIWKETGCSPIDYTNFKADKYRVDDMPTDNNYIYIIQLLIKGFFTNEQKVFDEASYNYFIKWLAYPLQNPGKKLHTAAVLYSEKQGVGKGSLCQVMSDIYGESYVRILGSDLGGQFNDLLFKKQFVFIDEIRSGDKAHVVDTLKALITEPTLILSRKFQPSITLDNTINFILATNYDYALPMPSEDRRFFVVNISQKPPEPFFIKFHEWRKDKGSASFYHYLLNSVDLTGFNPHQMAPINEAKQAIIVANMSELEAIIDEIYYDLPPVLTSLYVASLIKMKYDSKYAAINAIGRILRKKGASSKVIRNDGNTINVWMLRKEDAKKETKELISILYKNGVLMRGVRGHIEEQDDDPT